MTPTPAPAPRRLGALFAAAGAAGRTLPKRGMIRHSHRTISSAAPVHAAQAFSQSQAKRVGICRRESRRTCGCGDGS